MKKQMVFKCLSTFLLSALLFTGCGSKADRENTGSPLEELESLEDHIKLIKDNFVVDLGRELSHDSTDYLYVSENTDISQIELDFSFVDTGTCGKYQASAAYKDEQVYFTIEVMDLTAPKITAKSDHLVIPVSTKVDCNDLVEVEDLSPFELQFKDWKDPVHLFDFPGEYEYWVVATDAYGNWDSVKITITVEPWKLDYTPEIIGQISDNSSLSQAFRDYLLGNETAVIGEETDFTDSAVFSFGTPLRSGQSASFGDMCDMITSGTSDNEPGYLMWVGYGLLDCGMDGKPELAVCYRYFNAKRSSGKYLITILRKENNTLVMTYAYQTVDENPYLYKDGYLHYITPNDYLYCCGYLDASGMLRYIYTRHHILHSDVLEYLGEVDEDLQKLIKECVNIELYSLGDETYSCYWINDYYASDEQQEELSAYLSSYSENGIKLYSEEEIDRLITRHVTSLGLKKPVDRTEDDEVEWYILLSNQE